jgi:nitrogen regulatory protein P-II 1
LISKVRIDIACNEEFVDPCIKAIIEGANTGTVGDGKIMVTPLEECIRIRTDERGGKAI